MRKAVAFVRFVFALAAVVAVLCVPLRAEITGANDYQSVSAHLSAVESLISSCVDAGKLDDALTQLEEFDKYQQANDLAKCRLSVAEALRDAKRSQEAADLLKKVADDDPYNKVAPDAIWLLCNILYNDLKDTKSYGAYLTKLTTGYLPSIPSVKAARALYGATPPDMPRSQKILLDQTQGEASIFDRDHTGSCNFSQWGVIRALGKAGYAVHDNGFQPGEKLTAQSMSPYGLVIMTDGYAGSPPVSENTIKEITDYVQGGGRLLVVCSSKAVGDHTAPAHYNALVRQFGLEFDDQAELGQGSTVACTPGRHACVRGLKQFHATFGTRVTGGTAIGHYKSDPIAGITTYGDGIVVAAGIGTGFEGNTMSQSATPSDSDRQVTADNKAFLLKLAAYLMSGVQ